MASPAALAAWFAESYGRPPDLIWHAPGRVNLIGEHTDYNDGLVLPFAIRSGVLAAAALRTDGLLDVRSRQLAGGVTAAAVAGLRPGGVPGWAGYPAGAAWALTSSGRPLTGASLGIDSDLPMGAGLASSAALSCAVVSCLAALTATDREPFPSRTGIATLARRAEAEFVGMPCGIMDQTASMLGEEGHALLLDCRSGATTLVPLDPAGAGLRLLIVDTGVRHVLADGQYALRREQCEQAARALGAASLREISDPADLAGLPEPLRRRARHVVTENQRVRQAADRLHAGRPGDCGELLTASHRSLRDDFEVSWPAADRVVEAALAAGALGARMTGGGFGGSVLVLVPDGAVTEVTAGIRGPMGDTGAAAASFPSVAPAGGAREVWRARPAEGSRRG
jgi:galactokinase